MVLLVMTVALKGQASLMRCCPVVQRIWTTRIPSITPLCLMIALGEWGLYGSDEVVSDAEKTKKKKKRADLIL